MLRSHLKGRMTARSVSSRNWKRGGRTPMICLGVPSRMMVWPMADGEPANFLRQKP